MQSEELQIKLRYKQEQLNTASEPSRKNEIQKEIQKIRYRIEIERIRQLIDRITIE